MQKNNDNRLPMYVFFERLRENQFPLGIGEYQLFLNALQHGFGLNPQTSIFGKDKILRLCKLIWLKPDQSIQLFEELFEAAYFFEATNSNSISKPITSPTSDNLEDDNSIKIEDNKPQNETRNLPSKETPKPESIQFDTTQEQEISNQSVSVKLAMGQNEIGRDLDINSGQKIDLEKSKFLFSQHYYPINQRKTQQNLRLFPKFRYTYNTLHIDIEATINKTIEKGIFTEALFQKAKNNTAQLLLLIDHQGSMIAFQNLAAYLKSQIEKALNINSTKNKSTFNSFYFYNLPRKHLYKNMAHTKAESIDNVINNLRGKDISIIVFSDAGAARGRYNTKRIIATQAFLRDFHECTHKIAWLNPMPKERWEDTSAEEISKQVAMFEATENGIKNVVLQLKGSINTKTIRI